MVRFGQSQTVLNWLSIWKPRWITACSVIPIPLSEREPGGAMVIAGKLIWIPGVSSRSLTRYTTLPSSSLPGRGVKIPAFMSDVRKLSFISREPLCPVSSVPIRVLPPSLAEIKGLFGRRRVVNGKVARGCYGLWT